MGTGLRLDYGYSQVRILGNGEYKLLVFGDFDIRVETTQLAQKVFPREHAGVSPQAASVHKVNFIVEMEIYWYTDAVCQIQFFRSKA